VIIDDYILLGSSYPQPLKDGRLVRCSAGYSPSMGSLQRIYPVEGFSDKFKQWNVLKVPVEKGDWRDESWKIKNSKNIGLADRSVGVLGKLNREEKINLINDLPLSCPLKLFNENRSLGIIKPDILSCDIKNNKAFVTFNCLPNCDAKNHHIAQILDWGAQVWIKNNPDNKEQVFSNYHFNEVEYDVFFLVGNSYRHARSFMVISVIRYKNTQTKLI